MKLINREELKAEIESVLNIAECAWGSERDDYPELLLVLERIAESENKNVYWKWCL